MHAQSTQASQHRFPLTSPAFYDASQPERTSRLFGVSRRLLLLSALFWLIAIAALFLLSQHNDPPVGWDDGIFLDAAHSLASGHDPYADSLAAESAYYALVARQGPQPAVACSSPPCPYVYAPITLKILPALASLPFGVLHHGFQTLYLLCAIAVPLSLLYACRPGLERNIFLLLAPGALFYPGLVLNFVVFSGNVAYLLYGLALPAAVLGWKTRRWLPFYLAVLLASCWKAPLLSLVAIPLLSDSAAWLGSLLTAVLGSFFFSVQALIWPQLFHHFLQVLDMLFRHDADFGLSPAGLLGRLLFFHNIYYSPWTSIAYLLYAPIIFLLLWKLRRRYLQGELTLQSWIPVLLVGTLLLNPRVKEYDIAAMTMPLALLAWRFFGRNNTFARTVLESVLSLLAAGGLVNLIGLKCTCCLIITGLFAAGTWQLFHPGSRIAGEPEPVGSPNMTPDLAVSR